jgi:hypothetical protein
MPSSAVASLKMSIRDPVTSGVGAFLLPGLAVFQRSVSRFPFYRHAYYKLLSIYGQP